MTHAPEAAFSQQPLRPISLPDLRLQAAGIHWTVDQPIAGIETLTPVRGELKALHHGSVLELEATIAAIVTLRCDRCLGHYNHPLQASVRELIELRSPEVEQASTTAGGDGSASAPAAFRQDRPPHRARPEPLQPPISALSPGFEEAEESLDPAGRFDPEHWIFEQLSLRLPLVNRCGADCPGPATWSSEAAPEDPRWAALAALRRP